MLGVKIPGELTRKYEEAKAELDIVNAQLAVAAKNLDAARVLMVGAEVAEKATKLAMDAAGVQLQVAKDAEAAAYNRYGGCAQGGGVRL